MKVFYAVVFLLAGLAPALSAQSATDGLRPGDVLRVSVWREPTLSGEFAITADGHVAHPLYRELNVVGKSMSEVEAAFRTLLSRLSTTPQFVIDPLVRVAVAGEVRNPSIYSVPTMTTISQVIAMAGGATERGNLESVRVYRNGREEVVDVTGPKTGLAQRPVQSGDEIFVERRAAVFRDYIAPAAGIVGALAAVLNIFLSN